MIVMIIIIINIKLYYQIIEDLGGRRCEVESSCFCLQIVQNDPYNDTYLMVTFLSS